jgi:hypothetical protein
MTASAYICDKDAAGPLSVVLEKMPAVTQYHTPQTLKAVFKNDSANPVTVSLAAESIEQVAVSLETREVTVPANGSAETAVRITCGEGTYSAHYPVHLLADFTAEGQTYRLHPVQVFETDFGVSGASRKIVGPSPDGREVMTGELITDAGDLPVVVMPEQGGVPLVANEAYRVTWRQFREENAPPTVLHIGWQGNDETSRMSLTKTRMTRGGVSRESLAVHPPYHGGPGTMFHEQLVRLPGTRPILFSSHVAIRDIHPAEPESDGVTFAVWIGDEKIGEKHSASKTWEPFQVDLSQFAGQTVLLRLESHPGPKHDTTCDGAFWGTPLLFAGELPKLPTSEEKAKLPPAYRFSLDRPDNTNRKELFETAVTFGHCGFLDGVIRIGKVSFDGLRVEIDGQPLGTERSALSYGPWEPVPLEKIGKKRTGTWEPHGETMHGTPKLLRFKQKVFSQGRELEMLYTLENRGGALQLGVECSEPAAVTKVRFGPMLENAHADRVYFGHGYRITEPERFEVVNGGHSLSTSHVGFDFFKNQTSLLMATAFPPDRLIADPDTQTYTLSVAHSTTLTLLPGPCSLGNDGFNHMNAMDCAIRYRPLYGKQASAGVAKKAGRFVFDVWGGSFADHTKKLQQQMDYGVTDALFINHNWQRWGYDNRLQDIWPPNPQLGTLDEMKETLELCRKNGILYGLHDNYIDIYPDADGFRYDEVVSFEANGHPRKAWNNYGIDAQSYQLRPDRLMPFLERNFELMKQDDFRPTAYFVDVFASINLHEFWDRHGNRHSPAEMLDHWCQAFDRIREHLGGDHPTVSEAGSDFLIGHLDGADCQFLMLSAEPGDFRINIRCKEWVRVPWFDAVNHTRFSLHGAGYDNRYAANRGYDLHGDMSDDYLSTEILTGHALQAGYGSIGRNSIRKYWLAQPVARALADAELQKVLSMDSPTGQRLGNAKRVLTLWSKAGLDSHAVVCREEPKVADIEFMNKDTAAIPQYGYYFNRNDGLCSAIVKLPVLSADQNEVVATPVVEFSSAVMKGFRQHYFNPRQVGTNALPVMPGMRDFQKTGGNQFQMTIDWKVFRSLKNHDGVKDYAWFLHLEPPRRNWHQKLEPTVMGGGMPQTPVSQWEADTQTATGVLTFPEKLASGTYNVLVGLWDAEGDRHRVKLLGPTPDNSRILLGKLKVEKQGNRVIKLEFEPESEDSPELFARLLPAEKPVLDAMVGKGEWKVTAQLPLPFRSTGAVMLKYPDLPKEEERKTLEMTMTPLPEEPASAVTVALAGLIEGQSFHVCHSLIAVDRTGQKLRDVPYTVENGELRFETAAGEFAYRIVVRKTS